MTAMPGIDYSTHYIDSAMNCTATEVLGSDSAGCYIGFAMIDIDSEDFRTGSVMCCTGTAMHCTWTLTLGTRSANN